jgi:chlorobactene lauroyltransferase
VSRALGAGFRVLMEERNLARYRVFLKVGALPLRRTTPREAWADLAVARTHLAPGVSLWVFPQGVRRPAAEPITGCERGAAHLALSASTPVRIVPVAFRYPFLGEQLPEGFVLVGAPWVVEPGGEAGRRPLMARIEHELGATIARLDGRLATEETAGFRLLVHGKLSVNKRMDRFRHAVGLLGGRFEARNG